ncbi:MULTISPECIES: D-ribose ABC transporter substrate-binding protein [Paraburkholderia]|uniref:Erythritol transport system substrate-binding protein n=1 Tax=Paraburkholderia tropica TaxID=92647 RepID=A0AAQ1JW44_9BURK|nr:MULTISPECIES: D-ribose ABC transporter substrate-binding protein [Paraburkholderia]MBB2983310.1 erythritol transport system substrate-binding protein [Paraburkholderia tropica]MBB3001779.1 erythritol transport system substrate-binding protein [Paraburkholderia tropica]MBB6321025.1 erythritol transport system substrate-binding protein [Paraburkholderia tropica]MBN3807502.1 substrate-binding domain-containing protein [Paraburkholderia sp. Ac-20347]MDE1144752.1 D-ribose ABC transporter substra
MWKKLALTAAVAATCVAALQPVDALAASKGTIAILVNALDNPYYAAEAKGAEKEAKKLGYDTIVLSHGEDVNKQNELVNLVIGKGVKGIILDNADSNASVATVRTAKEKHVPVVLINREIPKDGIAIAQLSHNNLEAGSEVAQRFVEAIGEKGDYVELTCNLADKNCVTRSQAFHQVLDQYPDLKMVARQDVKGALLPAKQAMDSILQEHQNIKGVIAGNGPAALGAIASLDSANRKDVIVMGIDGSNDERDSIRAGKLKATVMLQAQGIAQHGVDLLDKYIRTGSTGEPERQLTRGILITKDNASKVNDFYYTK